MLYLLLTLKKYSGLRGQLSPKEILTPSSTFVQFSSHS